MVLPFATAIEAIWIGKQEESCRTFVRTGDDGAHEVVKKALSRKYNKRVGTKIQSRTWCHLGNDVIGRISILFSATPGVLKSLPVEMPG